MKFFVKILFVWFFLVSCGLAPPKNVKYKSFVSFMQEFLNESNKAQNNKEMKYRIRHKLENIDFVLVANKGDRVDFVNTPTKPKSKKELIYYKGNGEFVFTRGVYITSYKTKFLFSFDLKKWYPVFAQDTSKKGDHENLINKIIFKPFLVSRSILRAPFEWRLYINDVLIEYDKLNKKEMMSRKVVQLGPDTVIVSEDKSKIKTDLEKVIMYIPEGTKIEFSIKSEGNIFSITNHYDTISMRISRDLYFYRPSKYNASISFNNKDWGLNIVAFKVGFSQEGSVKDSKLIYKYKIIANYKG